MSHFATERLHQNVSLIGYRAHTATNEVDQFKSKAGATTTHRLINLHSTGYLGIEPWYFSQTTFGV